MFASSAIQITQQTPGRLQITVPPYYSLILWIALAGLIMAGLTMIGGKKGDGDGRSLRVALAVLFPFVLAALGVVTSHSKIVLSRDTGMLTMDRWLCGLHTSSREISLSTVRSVNVETDRGSHSLALILKSGGVVRLNSFTPRPGQYAVQNAMNDFLGASR